MSKRGWLWVLGALAACGGQGDGSAPVAAPVSTTAVTEVEPTAADRIAAASVPSSTTIAEAPPTASPDDTAVAEVVWGRSVVDDPSGARSAAFAVTDGEIVAVGTAEGRLVGLDAVSGDERWSVDLSGLGAVPEYNSYGIYPAIDGGDVVAAVSTGHLLAFDATTGDEIWRSQVGGLPGGFPAIASGAVVVGRSWVDVYDDSVDFGGPDEQAFLTDVVGVDRRTGEVLWDRGVPVGGDGALRHAMVSAAGDDAHVVVVSGDAQYTGGGAVELLDAMTGEPVWQRSGFDVDTPAAFDGRTLVAAAGDVVAFDAAGEELWRTGAGWCACTFQFPSVVGDVAIVATNEAAVHAWHAPTGRECWTFGSGDVYVTTSAAGSGAAAVAFGGSVIWLDAATGDALAVHPAEGALIVEPIEGGAVVSGLAGVVERVEVDLPDRDDVVSC